METTVNRRSCVLRVFSDPSSMNHAAADLVAAACREAVASQGRFAIALSGGNTPRDLYRLLTEAPYRDQIDWAISHVFWVDERSVPPAHPDSNYGVVHDLLLSRVPLPPANIHRIHGEDRPETAALAYEVDLRKFFGTAMPAFDLVLLGMGEDGHTASLFPSHPAVEESARLVIPVVNIAGGHQRVTMTLPVLAHASVLLFFVTGFAKAEAVSKVLEQGNPERYPAGMVNARSSKVQWFMDRAAASLLNNKKRSCREVV